MRGWILKIMRFIIITIFFASALLPLNFAHAAVDIGIGQGGLADKVRQGGGYGSATDTTLSESIGKIIRVLLSLSGTIFLALTVYAGFLWMTAGGNDERITKAQGILKTSVIGLIIIVTAYSITYFALTSVFKVGDSQSQVGAGGASTQQGGFLSGFAQGFTGASSQFWK